VPARLVKARGESDRIGEPDPAEVDLDGWIASGSTDPFPRERKGQQCGRNTMRGLGGEREERRAADGSVPPVSLAISLAIPSAVAPTHVRMLAIR
jgi:hypothetical protein